MPQNRPGGEEPSRGLPRSIESDDKMAAFHFGGAIMSIQPGGGLPVSERVNPFDNTTRPLTFDRQVGTAARGMKTRSARY